MDMKRCICYIDEYIYYVLKNFLKNVEEDPYKIKFDTFLFYVYDENHDKVGTLKLKHRDSIDKRNKCVMDFSIKNIIESRIIKNIEELCGFYLISVNKTNYCINIDIGDVSSTDFSWNLCSGDFEIISERMNSYEWKLCSNNMSFVSALSQYVDLSKKLETSLFLYSLIYTVDEVKSDFKLKQYIEKKFEYFGYNIKNTSSNIFLKNFDYIFHTINNNEIANDFEGYYNFFYDLFKYLWNSQKVNLDGIKKHIFNRNINLYFKTLLEKYIISNGIL